MSAIMTIVVGYGFIWGLGKLLDRTSARNRLRRLG